MKPRQVAHALRLMGALAGLGVAAPAWSAAADPARCAGLAHAFVYPDLHIAGTETVAAGALRRPGIAEAMPEHCVVRGSLAERVGPVDGKSYAIGFEMRLPAAWNGRFFYQANGGLDGVVVPAFGDILGGGPASNGLLKGFAVLSSDAGHLIDTGSPGIGAALFGIDPQARIDYGYAAIAKLAPMAKALISAYYGKAPDRSYLVGTSNGGREAMVAAARDIGGFDGILAGSPGFNLPLSALAQVWGAQQLATIARSVGQDGRPDLQTSFSTEELALVAGRVLERCDELDGLKDGIVADLAGCQKAFSVDRDVPACQPGQQTGCLDPARKAVLATLFAGPRRNGKELYAPLPWDAGVGAPDWRAWKAENSIGPRDAIALAFVFTTPPASPAEVSGKGTTIKDYALHFDIDKDGGKVAATGGVYTVSAMDFMTPPDAAGMTAFVARGGKLVVLQGGSDPVFSAADTIGWYEAFRKRHGPRAAESARLFLVPGMNHSRGGPATDQLDMVDALLGWTEQGNAPNAVVATARGVGTALPNPDVPADWSPRRSRPLCAYPQVTEYVGGDIESATSFRCSEP